MTTQPAEIPESAAHSVIKCSFCGQQELRVVPLAPPLWNAIIMPTFIMRGDDMVASVDFPPIEYHLCPECSQNALFYLCKGSWIMFELDSYRKGEANG